MTETTAHRRGACFSRPEAQVQEGAQRGRYLECGVCVGRHERARRGTAVAATGGIPHGCEATGGEGERKGVLEVRVLTRNAWVGSEAEGAAGGDGNRAGRPPDREEGDDGGGSISGSLARFLRRGGAARRAGADGVDGVLRGGRSRRRGAGNGAEDVGHGSRLGFGLDPEKRGSGIGEREIAQVRVDVVHLTSRRARENDGRVRGMAPVRGREEKERLTVGPTVSDFNNLAEICFSLLVQ